MSKAEQKPLRIALAGNPNAGKTTLFNALTGARQHVGNYPGVTVEKRTGSFFIGDRKVDVTDLPGTYSLTSFSPEERVARDELLTGDHDLIVVVADSTALQRSLSLLAQMMQLGTPCVLCLNMADEARASGQRLDLEMMSKLLAMPVVETVGHRGQGTEELGKAILEHVGTRPEHGRLVLGEELDVAIQAVRAKLGDDLEEAFAGDWIATRLIVGDEGLWERFGSEALDAEIKAQRKTLEELSGRDVSLYVTECYFGFVDGLLREVMTNSASEDHRAQSNAIDRILVHRVWGLPIFAVIMYGIFFLTFTLGEPPMGWIEAGFGWLGETVSGFWAEGSDSALRSLLVDGVIGGVGGVLVFLPNIVLLFFGLAILEDTGYMARAAFLMDRVMHRFGLHGKSFVPMMTGFGCNIPGIMATRTLENERDRLTTMMVLPLMSCGARLPIWLLLVPAFFAPEWRAPALWGIYSLGIILALVLALVMRKTILAGDDAPFVMELPPYRFPTRKALIKKMTEKAWIYLQKAGTVILAVSIVLWFLAAYPKKEGYEIDQLVESGQAESLSAEEIEQIRVNEDLQHSVAGRIGRGLEPVIAPMGFDWKIGTALIGAFAAKEVFVAQMGIVYSMGEVDEGSDELRDQLSRDYPPVVGLSLMIFLLIATPCMATIAVTRRESGSWKWAFLQFGGLTAIGFLLSTFVYQIGRLF